MRSNTSLAHALKWAYTANWGERGFSALFTFVLAAILGPRDFGVISIALIYIQFIKMLLEQGLVAALIQRHDLDSDHVDTAFWTNMGESAFLIVISVLLSRWWAAANALPALVPIIFALSLCIPIEALSLVQIALLKRNMNFKPISVRSNVSVVVGGTIGVMLAFAGCGVWALVVQQIVRDLMSSLLLWRLGEWRPRLRFSFPHLRDLFKCSVSTFIAQLGMFTESQAPAAVLGMLFGPVAVGLYRLADRFVSTILSAAVSSIQMVALPEFSRFQHDPKNLRRSVVACIRLGATCTVPAFVGLSVISRPLMQMIGPKWLPASQVLPILCISGIALTFASFTAPLLQAVSKAHHSAVLEWLRTAGGVTSVVVAGLLVRHSDVQTQIVSVAVARLGVTLIVVGPLFLSIVLKRSGATLGEIIRVSGPALASATGVGTSIVLFRIFFGWTSKAVVLLGSEAVIGAVTGVSILVILDSQLRSSLMSAVNRMHAYGSVTASAGQ